MDIATYSYSSLAAGQIHLIHLVPGSFNDAIVCNLRKVQYRSGDQYEALSYVWGSEHDKHRILLNGRHFLITSSLELALRHLRHPSDERVIWVDQICINQADQKEKTEQVKLMGDIYRNASKVLIWLGKEIAVPSESRTPEGYTSDECKRAFELISIFATDEHIDQIRCFKLRREKRLRPTKEFSYAFPLLSRLVEMAWWTRIWTVQEIVLARKAKITIGDQSISWEQLAIAADSIRKHRNSCCLHLFAGLPFEFRTALDGFYFRIEKLARRKDRHEVDTNLDLILDLQEFRHRQSRDPLDKVYGILGLFPDKKITVDYSRSVVQVYTDVLMDTILEEDSVRVLMDENNPRQDNQDFPSWVIDWREPVDNNQYVVRVHKYLVYRASKNHPASAKLIHNSLLQLTGFKIDKISSIEYSAPQPYGIDVYTTLDKFVTLFQTHCSPKSAYVTGGNLGDAFRRTTLGNRVWEISENSYGYRSITENDIHLWEAFCTARRAWTNEDPYNMIGHTVEHSVFNRAFFLTERGYMGIGPRTAKVGDDVCLVLGSNVPFVTRSVDDSCVKQSEGWDSDTIHCRLVGDCYVHGIMEGEAVDLPDTKYVQIVLY